MVDFNEKKLINNEESSSLSSEGNPKKDLRFSAVKIIQRKTTLIDGGKQMKQSFFIIAVVFGLFTANPVLASDLTVPMNLVSEQGVGNNIGTVTIAEKPEGLVFTPKLSDLTPGAHGFHVHQNPDCAASMKDNKMVPGLAAGGHFDPAGTGKHEGHAGKGHLGDLPVLTVNADGTATTAVTALRLKMTDVLNRSIMIHAGGDNYSDEPAPLGGGGARVACGVIK
jgi:superoxide dismutase, Cu-Zn family